MNTPKSVNLSRLKGSVEIEPNYHVELPDTEYFILVAGGKYPAAATRYDHPNVAARKDRVLLTRACWPNGRKEWFQHAGRDFYFIIPRNQITLVFAKGYSYVPVIVNGQRMDLNVSGGTVDGWTDCVSQQSRVCIHFTKKKLDLVSEVALPPAEARGRVSLELTELSKSEAADFVDLVAARLCRSRLEQGHKLVLRDGWSYEGSRGPFSVQSKSKKRRHYVAEARGDHKSSFRAAYKSIDWTETAAINGFAIEGPVQENRVGGVGGPGLGCAAYSPDRPE